MVAAKERSLAEFSKLRLPAMDAKAPSHPSSRSRRSISCRLGRRVPNSNFRSKSGLTDNLLARSAVDTSSLQRCHLRRAPKHWVAESLGRSCLGLLGIKVRPHVHSLASREHTRQEVQRVCQSERGHAKKGTTTSNLRGPSRRPEPSSRTCSSGKHARGLPAAS